MTSTAFNQTFNNYLFPLFYKAIIYFLVLWSQGLLADQPSVSSSLKTYLKSNYVTRYDNYLKLKIYLIF